MQAKEYLIHGKLDVHAMDHQELEEVLTEAEQAVEVAVLLDPPESQHH